ncbi:MAG: hypothetical protein IJ875_06965 [Solobacterium sp.]|nr:hypothetical protein [Solobacterium sp.]
MSEIYESIAKEKKEIILEYKCCIHDLHNKKESLIDMHKASRQKDFDYRNSSEGIHREDYIYYMNDDLVVNCASQGQKRMIILSFKLALAKYIKHISGKEAIFLLDDVMSELDENHRNALLNQLIKNNQCIITTTEKLNIPNMAIYRVNDGEITGGKK